MRKNKTLKGGFGGFDNMLKTGFNHIAKRNDYGQVSSSAGNILNRIQNKPSGGFSWDGFRNKVKEVAENTAKAAESGKLDYLNKSPLNRTLNNLLHNKGANDKIRAFTTGKRSIKI